MFCYLQCELAGQTNNQHMNNAISPANPVKVLAHCRLDMSMGDRIGLTCLLIAEGRWRLVQVNYSGNMMGEL